MKIMKANASALIVVADGQRKMIEGLEWRDCNERQRVVLLEM
jgi:hypothetical protein